MSRESHGSTAAVIEGFAELCSEHFHGVQLDIPEQNLRPRATGDVQKESEVEIIGIHSSIY